MLLSPSIKKKKTKNMPFERDSYSVLACDQAFSEREKNMMRCREGGYDRRLTLYLEIVPMEELGE